jgi:peptidoglycan/LPS O-acetylase OafA/YrhL
MVSDSAAYRGDVDGLRAVAVLLVIGFHFFPRYVPGGFIGVDVFFVISGFLITRLIVVGLEDGSFTLTDFYARRIRRIFPALALVLAVSLVAGWLLLFPLDYRDLGKHAAAAAVFIANFTFLNEAGYFDTSSELKPLLHLWSLGVEEQFYIVWPVLLLLAWRWRYSPFLIAAGLLVASFAWNVWLTGSNQLAAFYLPFTRFWELMLGGILAIASLVAADRGGPSARIREALSLSGLALLAAAVVLISRERAFPGWWAALPTIGTALMIFAGPQAFLNRLVLNYRPLVYVGLISYPLYLWHWPILTFARHIQFKEPTNLTKAAYIALAFALAHLTYQYIEKPIRFGKPDTRRPVLLAAAMAVIGFIGLAIYLAGGFASRYPSDVQNLFQDFRREAEVVHGTDLCARKDTAEFAVTTECPPTGGRRLIVVWGDSHAAHLLRGLIEIEKGKDDIQVVSFAHGGCPPILSFESPYVSDCASVNETVMQRMWQMKPDTVIMAGRWDIYEGLPKLDDESVSWTISRLKSMGVRKVVGVNQFPLWDAPVPKILARYYRTARASFAAASHEPLRDRDRLVQSAFAVSYAIGRAFLTAGATVVSPPATLCNAAGCLLTVPGTAFEPIAGDQTHLTYAGSIYFLSRNAEALTGN